MSDEEIMRLYMSGRTVDAIARLNYYTNKILDRKYTLAMSRRAVQECVLNYCISNRPEGLAASS